MARRLSIQALPAQWDLWNDYSDRARVAVVGPLGTGKTRTLVIKDMLLHLYNTRHAKQSFGSMLVEPTYGMVQDILIPTIEEVLNDELQIGVRIIGASGRPKMYWPGRLHGCYTLLRSAEEPNRLTGSNLSHVGYDEPGQILFDAWKKGISRARHPAAATRQVFAVGSPEGTDNWFSELFNDPKPPYRRIRAREWHPRMRHYPAELAKTYEHDPGQLAAYLDGDFVPMFTGRCYGSFSRSKHWDSQLALDPNLDLILACDFNIDAMRWLVGQETPRELWVLDEIVGGFNEEVAKCAAEFCHRYAFVIPPDSLAAQLIRKHHGGEVPPHGTLHRHNRAVTVVGDFAGNSRSQTGETCYTSIANVLGPCFPTGFNLDLPESGNPMVVDRVRAVQWHLAGHGYVVRIAPHCIELTKDFEQNTWMKTRADVQQSHEAPGNQRTHASSAFGYWVMQRARPSNMTSTAVTVHLSEELPDLDPWMYTMTPNLRSREL